MQNLAESAVLPGKKAPVAQSKALECPERLRLSTVCLLTLILVAAAGLRSYQISRWSMWEDEFYSLACSTGKELAFLSLPTDVIFEPHTPATAMEKAVPWSAMWLSMPADIHPPLYFMILRVWREVLGDSEAALRSLSVLLSLVAIVFFFDAVRHCGGNTAALWAAALMAVAAQQISTGREIRNYVLMLMFGMAACAALMRIEYRGFTWRRGICLGLATLGLGIAHYYAFFSIAVIACYAMVVIPASARWKMAGIMAVTGVICLAMLLPVALNQIHYVKANNLYNAQNDSWLRHLVRTAGRLSLLPFFFLCNRAPDHVSWCSLAAVAYVVPLPLLRRTRQIRFWYFFFITPVAIIASFDVLHHGVQTGWPRYFTLACPGLLALIALASSGKCARWRFVFPASAVLLCLFGLPRNYERGDDYRDLVLSVRANVTQDDILVYAATCHDATYNFYYCPVSHYGGPAQFASVFLSKPADANLLRDLRSRTQVWLVHNSQEPIGISLPGAWAQRMFTFRSDHGVMELDQVRLQ